MDGGVLANNPCDCGLTAIQNFYRMQGEKLRVAVVVSVGTGVYPPEKLGKVDAQEFLFFGKHWFKLSKLRDRATNLISLLSNAVSNPMYGPASPTHLYNLPLSFTHSLFYLLPSFLSVLTPSLIASPQLVNSEIVAMNCKSRCEEIGIPYYRLSPKLDEVRCIY